MADFNESVAGIGQKLRGLSASVGDKAKEVSETARIKAAIAEQEKARAQECQKLGAAWYDAHGSDNTEEFQDFTQAIARADETIEKLNQQLQDLLSKKVCPSCGKLIPLNARFCQYCGADLLAPVSQDALCPSCGKPYVEGDRFCQYCGAPLSQQDHVDAQDTVEPHPEPSPAESTEELPGEEQDGAHSPVPLEAMQERSPQSVNSETVATFVEPTSGGATCGACGYVNLSGSRFCRACGSRLA